MKEGLRIALKQKWGRLRKGIHISGFSLAVLQQKCNIQILRKLSQYNYKVFPQAKKRQFIYTYLQEVHIRARWHQAFLKKQTSDSSATYSHLTHIEIYRTTRCHHYK